MGPALWKLFFENGVTSGMAKFVQKLSQPRQLYGYVNYPFSLTKNPKLVV